MTIDVIRIAREAHWALVTEDYPAHTGQLDPWTLRLLERFTALVATALQEEANRKANAGWALMCKKMVEVEREECAKVVSETVEWKSKGWTSTICPITKGAIAAAIRARKPA